MRRKSRVILGIFLPFGLLIVTVTMMIFSATFSTDRQNKPIRYLNKYPRGGNLGVKTTSTWACMREKNWVEAHSLSQIF